MENPKYLTFYEPFCNYCDNLRIFIGGELGELGNH